MTAGKLIWYPQKALRRFWNWEVYKGKEMLGSAYTVSLWLYEDSVTQARGARLEVMTPGWVIEHATELADIPIKNNRADVAKLKEWAKEWVTRQLVSPMEMLTLSIDTKEDAC